MLVLYNDMNRILDMEHGEEQYRNLLKTFAEIEESDKRFIRETMAAVSAKKLQEMEIASMLLVNRLFTQACRLQIFSLKDLLLTLDQINEFDRALDMRVISNEGKEE